MNGAEDTARESAEETREEGREENNISRSQRGCGGSLDQSEDERSPGAAQERGEETGPGAERRAEGGQAVVAPEKKDRRAGPAAGALPEARGKGEAATREARAEEEERAVIHPRSGGRQEGRTPWRG